MAKNNKPQKKTPPEVEITPSEFSFIDFNVEAHKSLPEKSLGTIISSDPDGEGLAISEEQFVNDECSLEKQDWSKVFTTPIKQILDHSYIGKPIRLLGRISEQSNPRPIKIGKNRKQATIIIITIRDEFGTELKLFPVIDESLRKVIIKDTTLSKKLIFCGAIYPKYVFGKSSLFMFSLHQIIETITADDLIYPRYEPDERTAKIFHSIDQKPHSIRDYIKSELVKNLDIRGLDKAIELDKCIDFMILQSLSDGYKDNFTMKLHSLVIGPPASGKKLLVDIAKILNPVSEHISAIDGKITVAGLVGRTISNENGSESVGGSIPKASGGTLMIEDFHNIKRNRSAIMGAFAEVMEDGTVKDSTSANKKHEANTSIHIDMNRISQIDRTATVDKHSDINIFSNVISRFDFIMDIPDDRRRQINVALKMLEGARTFNGFSKKSDPNDWERLLKRFIAYYRTMYRWIQIDENTSEYIKSNFNKIIEDNKNYMRFTKYFTLHYNATRLVHSIDKICVASARSRRSLYVQKEDVDIAFSFIQEKLKFLQQYEEYLSVPDFSASTGEQDKRRSAIHEEFGGKEEIRYSEIRNYLGKNAESLRIKSVERKTIYEDLKHLNAVSPKRGFWNIPK